jgi:endonuclease G
MKGRTFTFSVLFIFYSSFALAAQTACPGHYLGGQAPDFLSRKLSPKSQEICYKGYAVIYSGISRTALESAEHLTRERLMAHHPKRVNSFHPDPNVPESDRAELKDYVRSHYDRGHMAPSGDMWDEQSQYESFSLANMIPQDPDDNRHLWEGIESSVRSLAKREGELYVVTGAIFYGSDLKRIHGRVLVPTYIYKAVYDPRQKEAAAYLVKNEDGDEYAVISIAQLDKLAGLSVFPTLSDGAKQRALMLPRPRLRQGSAVEDESIVPKL